MAMMIISVIMGLFVSLFIFVSLFLVSKLTFFLDEVGEKSALLTLLAIGGFLFGLLVFIGIII